MKVGKYGPLLNTRVKYESGSLSRTHIEPCQVKNLSPMVQHTNICVHKHEQVQQENGEMVYCTAGNLYRFKSLLSVYVTSISVPIYLSQVYDGAGVNGRKEFFKYILSPIFLLFLENGEKLF